MKGKTDCYKKGGKVKETKAEESHEEEKKEHKKSHKAHGGHVKKRADKRARGGKISTPKSPISGAMPGGLPGTGHKSEND